MAIDYNAIQISVDAIDEKVHELKNLIRVGREGKVAVDLIGDIDFTTTQKTALVAKYNDIKVEMATLFNDLP